MHYFFPISVYILCLLTCTLCAFLLTRSYFETRVKLLFWSAFCFIFLAANSLLVILDIVVFPDVNFGVWRPLLSLAAVSILLFGFIWDLESE